MTLEEKQLLLTDLCARLPYGVKVKISDEDVLLVDSEKGTLDGKETMSDGCFTIKCDKDSWIISCDEFKPYLRPLPSMTEKETYIFRQDILNEVEARCIHSLGSGEYSLAFTEANDWLNANHFDYRGLIKKGLALEAPEGMYKTE